MVIVGKCPRCGSTNCAPTWYTRYSAQCIPCGHDFDMRGGFWARVGYWFRVLKSIRFERT
jgi:hypothetical protein